MRTWPLVVVSLVCSTPGAAVAQPPAVHLTPSVLDLGDLARNTERAARVELYNRGAKDVRILAGGADCPCLSVDISPTTLRPGRSIAVQVTLRTCESLGTVRRRVWVELAGEPCLQLPIPVHYRVLADVYAEPETLSLGWVGESPRAARLTVRSWLARPIRLLGVRCDHPAVATSIEQDVVTRDAAGAVAVQVAAPLAEGPLRATLWIATDAPEQPELRVPLLGESILGVECTCSEVVFESVPVGQGERRQVELTCAAGAAIGGVRISGETVDVLGLTRDGSRTTLTLATLPTAPMGLSRGYVSIEVTGSTPRTLKLPYRVQIVGPRLSSDFAPSAAAAVTPCLPRAPAASSP